jgi:hypothetical protein
MYEVKVTFRFDGVVRQVTLASFEQGDGDGQYNWARGKALRFARQVDEGYAVDVIYVPDENFAGANFGLVYHRDAAL